MAQDVRDPASGHWLWAPGSAPLLLALALLFGLAYLALQLALVEYAYRKIGIESRYLFALLALSFVGSAVNLPLARLRGERVLREREVRASSVHYRLPEIARSADTVVAVNVGGALVPLGISGYLLWTNPGSLWVPLAVVALVTLAVHRLAMPVPGVGIAVPMWVPPLVAAAAALALAPEAPARAAYVGGTLGALVGGDLLNLG
jgi:uncharacterized membrane protein